VSRHEPMFNIPGSVVALLAAMGAIHLVRWGLSADWSTWLTLALAFIPARYAGFAEILPGGSIASVTSFLTHAFLHGDLLHLGINAAWLLAFGGAVASRIGAIRFLLFFAFCAVVGAATFLLFNPGIMVPMIGASGAISGLMGGTMRFMFTAIDGRGLAALREAPGSVPLMPLRQALTDKRVLLVTVTFLAANILAVLGLGSFGESGIAWEAHIGGYFAGLLTFGFFDPQQTRHSSAGANIN
jgi:membrane associated rhomboid family serine protease